MQGIVGADIVDAHIHMWLYQNAVKTWLTPETPPAIKRSFGVVDLEVASKSLGVGSFVQVHAGELPEDNAYLEECSSSSELILAVVPYVDLEDPKLEKHLDRWQPNPKFRGVRVTVELYPDPDYLARPAVIDGLGLLAARGLSFDFLVRIEHLRHVLAIYERHPGLFGVIDHMAKPEIETGRRDVEWRSWMRELARIPTLYCKISGLLTETGGDCSAEKIKPYLQEVIECFGFDRLMWGSDWPVSTIRADYTTTFETIRQAIGSVSPEDERRLYRETADHFYRLDLRHEGVGRS